MASQRQTMQRKRGRPAGKNRAPLSLDERRARNALYERERRNETAEAMSQLSEAVGCATSVSSTELLATVVGFLQRAASRDSFGEIDALRRCNANLSYQIETLTRRLLEDPDMTESSDNSCHGTAIRTHASGKGMKRIKMSEGFYSEPEVSSSPDFESEPDPLQVKLDSDPDHLVAEGGLTDHEISWADIGNLMGSEQPLISNEIQDPIHRSSIEDFVLEYL